MITILEGLRAHLLEDNAIAALVTTSGRARAFPLKLPQHKDGVPDYPAIQLQRISGLRYTPLKGVASLARPRYQLDSWGETFQAAMRLGSLCRQRLDGQVFFVIVDGSPGTLIRVAVNIDDESDRFEEDISAGVFRHSADYFVHHGTDGGLI